MHFGSVYRYKLFIFGTTKINTMSKVCLWFSILFILLSCNIKAQNREQNLPEDSLISYRGNVFELTQNIFKSFQLYTQGNTKSFENAPAMPVVIVYDKDDNEMYLSKSDLQQLDKDDVEWIRVDHGIFQTVLYGTRALACVIKIKLKDKVDADK